jgi:mono/diheme cytochrome c family protein
VTDGQGAMPGFGGQMTEAEIALLADYLVEVSHEAAQ